MDPARRPAQAPGAAHLDPRAGRDRGLQPVPAQRDARRAGQRLHPHRPRQGPHPAPGAAQARPAHRADPDGHVVRLQRRRTRHRCDVHREDLRLARHGRMVAGRHRHAGHQHRRRGHGVRRRDVLLSGLLSDVVVRRARSRGCGCDDRTNPRSATRHAASRRGSPRAALVRRRFLRNRPAVVALALLVLLFVAASRSARCCPTPTPISTTTRCNSRPPPTTGSAPTRSARTCSPKRCADCRSRC